MFLIVFLLIIHYFFKNINMVFVNPVYIYVRIMSRFLQNAAVLTDIHQ